MRSLGGRPRSPGRYRGLAIPATRTDRSGVWARGCWSQPLRGLRRRRGADVRCYRPGGFYRHQWLRGSQSGHAIYLATGGTFIWGSTGYSLPGPGGRRLDRFLRRFLARDSTRSAAETRSGSPGAAFMCGCR